MNPDVVLELLKETLTVTFTIAGPILLLTLVVGITVSIFQTVTSVQEMTLSFVPKLIVISLALILVGPWMLHQLTFFTVGLIQRLPDFAR
ncbi:MAG: flagellar biosynthesis protein FliQ [Verrucomicrobia bacterium]|nr:flagellar biosynthesis protein FliQ [Verrucomicrobiota bacterium]